MERFGWQPVREGEHVIGCTMNGALLSLEPGGQFELSGAAVKTIHETCAETNCIWNRLARSPAILAWACWGWASRPPGGWMKYR